MTDTPTPAAPRNCCWPHHCDSCPQGKFGYTGGIRGWRWTRCGCGTEFGTDAECAPTPAAPSPATPAPAEPSDVDAELRDIADYHRKMAALKPLGLNFAWHNDLAMTMERAVATLATLRAELKADDERLRVAEERVWPGETHGCDAPDWMADEILTLRAELAEAKEVERALIHRNEERLFEAEGKMLAAQARVAEMDKRSRAARDAASEERCHAVCDVQQWLDEADKASHDTRSALEKGDKFSADRLMAAHDEAEKKILATVAWLVEHRYEDLADLRAQLAALREELRHTHAALTHNAVVAGQAQDEIVKLEAELAQQRQRAEAAEREREQDRKDLGDYDTWEETIRICQANASAVRMLHGEVDHLRAEVAARERDTVERCAAALDWEIGEAQRMRGFCLQVEPESVSGWETVKHTYQDAAKKIRALLTPPVPASAADTTNTGA